VADNIVLNSGSGGATLAADDITSVWYQIVKLAHGALDSATLVSTTSGLPVQQQGTWTLGANSGVDIGDVTLTANSGVDIGDVDVLSVVPGTGATNLGKAEDAAHSTGDVGVMALGIRDDTLSVFSNLEGDYEPFHMTATGRLYTSATVDAALPAGSNNIGDVDVLTVAAGSNLIGDVGLQGRTSGGLTPYKTIDLDETEEEIKATAGQVYGMHVMNLTAAPLYFKMYNATAATVVVGTTVPTITIPIPGNNDSDGAGFVWSIPQGIAFGTAITIACTTGVADADAGAPATNACVATVLYV